MKKVTRNEMFETNSSSVHTLVYSGLKREKPNLAFYCRDGQLVHKVRGGIYSCEGTLRSQQEKLNYLISWLFIHKGSDLETLLNSWSFEDIQRWICDYTGAQRLDVKLKEDYWNEDDEDAVYFDHQSHPSHDQCPVNYYDKNSVLDFIFGEGVELQMSHD